LAEALDIVVCAGFLATELVAWEAEDNKVVAVRLLHLLVELLETFILRCETAF
jgi:hypothetical protein